MVRHGNATASIAPLDDGQLGRSNVEGVHIRCQPRESLLRAIGPAGLSVFAILFRNFIPTYLIKVLILTHSTSYIFFNASLICLLFALTSTMNTSVLFSSIFFIALSVLSGCTMILEASRRGSDWMLLRGYLGERERVRVFGRWKEVDVRTLRDLCELTCCEAGRQTMGALTRLKWWCLRRGGWLSPLQRPLRKACWAWTWGL